MKKLLLFGALAFGFNAFGQETITVESKFDLSELRLYGRYGTEDEVYYINESESSDFQLDYYEMMGERTLMSCSGEGSIKNGELLVKEFDGACWGDEEFKIFFSIKDGIISLVINGYYHPIN